MSHPFSKYLTHKETNVRKLASFLIKYKLYKVESYSEHIEEIRFIFSLSYIGSNYSIIFNKPYIRLLVESYFYNRVEIHRFLTDVDELIAYLEPLMKNCHE